METFAGLIVICQIAQTGIRIFEILKTKHFFKKQKRNTRYPPNRQRQMCDRCNNHIRRNNPQWFERHNLLNRNRAPRNNRANANNHANDID